MTPTRTGWLGILAVAVVSLGVCVALYWPSASIPGGGELPVAAPRDGGQWSVAQRHTLGLKADLNSISEEELGRIPGIGRPLAKNLVEARRRLQRFHSWDEVDAVRGVGPVKLKRLQELTEIRPK